MSLKLSSLYIFFNNIIKISVSTTHPYFNKIENRNPYFLPGIILLLLGISFCTFMADYTCDFESTYILQTFRIWYWLLFFSLGQMFRKLNLGGAHVTS